MSLKLHIQHPFGGQKDILDYDPLAMTLKFSDGSDFVPKYEDTDLKKYHKPAASIRLVMGKKCNLRCKYCSQDPTKPHGDYLLQARKDKVALNSTLDKILKFAEEKNVKSLNLWGGEPLIYFNLMQHITEYVKKNSTNIRFATLTNGTILTERMVNYFLDNEYTVTISHDGPKHSIVRGINLLDDDKKLHLVKILAKESKIIENPVGSYPESYFNFNSVIHRYNKDHLALYQYLSEKIDMPANLAVIDPLILLFDEAKNYLIPDEELTDYTKKFYTSFYKNSDLFFNYFNYYRGNIYNFISELRGCERITNGMHCRTILDNVYAIDLYGNILTCQNEDPFTVTEYGDSHLRGNVFKNEPLLMPRIKSWEQRPRCHTCPVLPLCKNKCPHTLDTLHDRACKQYFHHYLPLLGMAISCVTNGYILTGIDGEFFHNKSMGGLAC